MSAQFIKSFYGSTPVEFKSSYDLEKSVSRLTAITESALVTSILWNRAIVGKVTANKVHLNVSKRLFTQWCNPYFFGSFRQDGKGVVLAGKFTLHPLSKIFLTFWFGLLLLWIILAMTMGSIQENLLLGVGLCALSLGDVMLEKWLTRNDVASISQHIKNALTPDPALATGEKK